MALPLPSLDSRTFDELVREGVRILPRRAPVWTDYNAHDPGITLIELFGWLVEMDLFRLDRTPDASIRAFLRLVGIEPLPPQIASTVLELAPTGGAGAIDVPAGLPVGDEASAVLFETAGDAHVAESRLVAVATVQAGERIDRTEGNADAGSTWEPLGSAPDRGDALLLAFDAPLGGGGETIAFHLWTDDPVGDAETRRRLVEEWRRARREAAQACPPGAEDRVPDWRRHYGARTVWEYRTSSGWAALDDVEDETRALSLTGFVRFPAPADHAAIGPAPGRWLVRCRLVAGAYECPPTVDRIGLNAVAARHAARLPAPEPLGASDGTAGQSFTLRRLPVVAGSAELHVVENGVEDLPWHEVAHWDRVGPHDRAFRLDPERGEIEFGDGRVGRVPSAGAKLSCRYRVGGGADGNVAAGRLVRPHGAAVEVTQPFAAFGGTAAETLDDARGRALDFLAERRRAITLSDLEELAVSTPGVPVARARALAGHHPALPCVTAAGCVTVVAVPECPAERPEAGADFLDAVRRWLAPRCALTTELHVVGPCYRTIGVRARLHAESGFATGALADAARAELDRFFHPLEGGPDGTGWPVGHDVYRSEVLAVLDALDGVAYVDRFGLVAPDEGETSCTDLAICPDCMAAAGEHDIRVIERKGVR